MQKSQSKFVKKVLENSEIHDIWEKNYRTQENNSFYNYAFDCIAQMFKQKPDSFILDAGCGFCTKSIHLAKRGFNVKAVDFSPYTIKRAKENVKENSLDDKISIAQGDITSLSFKDSSFEYILCWGVLMHVVDYQKAISELSRVLKPGGILVISENNMHSFIRLIVLPILRKLSISKVGNEKVTKEGIERWFSKDKGHLLAREANINYLISLFEDQGLSLNKRIAGQFTEVYTKISPGLLNDTIHAFNNFWFRFIKIPYLASCNLLFFKKN
jgi:ubiquinone/menaquinone biosynthesis C-methylase UbiE